MLNSKTSIAGFITLFSSIVVAVLTGDFTQVGTAVVTGLGLIAAKDGGM